MDIYEVRYQCLELAELQIVGPERQLVIAELFADFVIDYLPPRPANSQPYVSKHFDLKLTCLRHVTNQNYTPEQMVEQAQKLFDFVLGSGRKSSEVAA